jgi:hypothetical protein
MPLILQPTFSDKTRQQIEEHLLVVRARRMAAVVTYYAGVNAKNMHLIMKEQQRIAREYAMLARDLARMDKLDAAIEARLGVIVQHQQELDIYRGNIVEIEDDREESRQTSTSREGTGERPRPKPNGAVRVGRPPGA